MGFCINLFVSIDEYFISSLKVIDDLCTKRASKLKTKLTWAAEVMQYVETFPVIKTYREEGGTDGTKCWVCY